MAVGFLPPVVAVLTASIGEFQAKMGEAKAEMAKVEGSASKMGALGKTALLGLAAGAGVVVTESVKMASNFQSTMMLIQTQAHASAQEVDNMSKAVLALAPTVGIGPEKLAEGLYHVESTGLRGQAALDVLKASAQEAAIGLANFDDVTYAMSGVMSVAMKDVKDAADGVAYLNTIVGTGDMKMGDLAKAIGTGVLPVFKSAQLGMRDFGAAMSVMTDNTMPAEQAANHLKTAIMLMQNQSGPAAKALASIGIQSGDLARDLAKPDGFITALEDVKRHLEESGKSAVEQGQIIAKSFGGARSAATIEEFIGQLDKLQSKYHEMDTVAGRAKQQQDDWAATQGTFKQKMGEVSAQFQVWLIQIGEKLLPVLSKMADWFLGSVKWLGDHKEVLIAIASGAIPLLVAGIIVLTAAMWALAVAAWATGIPELILIFAALGFALYELLTHLKEVGHFFTWLWDTVWKWTSDRVTDIRNFIVSTFHDVIDWIVNHWNEFLGFWKDLWNGIWKWCTDTLDKIVNIFKDAPRNIGYALGHLAGEVVKGLIDAGEAIGHWVTVTLPDNFERGMTNLGHWFRNQGKSLLDGFVNGITDGSAALWNWVTVTLPDNFNRGMTNLGHWFRNQGKSIVDGFLYGITDGAAAVWNWITVTLPDNFDRGMTNLENWMHNQGQSIVDGFLSGLENAWNAVWKAVSDFCSGFINGFKDGLGIHSPSTIMAEMGMDLLRGLVNGIGAGAQWVWSSLSSLVSSIGGFFADAGNWLVAAGHNLLVGLYNGIVGAMGWLRDQVTSWASGLVNSIKGAFGIHSPSTIMHEMGGFLAKGLAAGIDSNAHLAATAAKAMSSRVLGAASGLTDGSLNINGTLSAAAMSAGAGAGSGGIQQITIQMDSRDVQRFIQEGILRYDLRNSSNGLTVGVA